MRCDRVAKWIADVSHGTYVLARVAAHVFACACVCGERERERERDREVRPLTNKYDT